MIQRSVKYWCASGPLFASALEKRAHHPALRVEDLERDRARRGATEHVVDHGARRRVARRSASPAAAACRGSRWRARGSRAPARTGAPASPPRFAASWRSGATSSSTQSARPCVAATRSLPCTSRSRTQAVGRFELQRLPGVAVVEGDEDAAVGAGVEQPRAHGSARTTVDEAARRQARAIAVQRRAVVARAVDVRREVVVPVGVDRGVRRAGIERRGVERCDLRPGGQRLAASRRFQFLPPSRVSCIRPSSVPTQISRRIARRQRDGEDRRRSRRARARRRRDVAVAILRAALGAPSDPG